MKPITNYRECDAGAWLKALADTEHEPDVETIATPIPTFARLPFTRSQALPQVVTRESLAGIGREAGEVDEVGSQHATTPLRRPEVV